MKVIFKLLVVFVLASTTVACVTLPGHRLTIDEPDFYLHIDAPSKETRNQIRFNTDQNALVYLPENTTIELKEAQHKLEIIQDEGAVVYVYRLNGQRKVFGTKEQAWFASKIPEIIERTGLTPRSEERN